MKDLIAVVLVILTFSCADKKAEAVVSDVENEKLNEIVVEKAVIDSPIPVYDFDGLEEALLQMENDTTYVVNFWATWCKPCIKELPYFEELGANYSEEKVKVVLVSIDFPENLHTKLLPYIDENKLQSDVVLLDDTDANTWIPKVSDQWEGSIPATLIFKNKKRKFYERSFNYTELENEVKSIL